MWKYYLSLYFKWHDTTAARIYTDNLLHWQMNSAPPGKPYKTEQISIKWTQHFCEPSTTEAPNNVDRTCYSVKDSERFGQNLWRKKEQYTEIQTPHIYILKNFSYIEMFINRKKYKNIYTIWT